MDTPQEHEHDRIRFLAESLDYISEPDFCLFAGITPKTAETWRKRGKGPAYVLIGTRYLYPRQALADHLQTLVRERRPQVRVRDLL
jgi:hypothetical protein